MRYRRALWGRWLLQSLSFVVEGRLNQRWNRELRDRLALRLHLLPFQLQAPLKFLFPPEPVLLGLQLALRVLALKLRLLLAALLVLPPLSLCLPFTQDALLQDLLVAPRAFLLLQLKLDLLGLLAELLVLGALPHVARADLGRGRLVLRHHACAGHGQHHERHRAPQQ